MDRGPASRRVAEWQHTATSCLQKMSDSGCKSKETPNVSSSVSLNGRWKKDDQSIKPGGLPTRAPQTEARYYWLDQLYMLTLEFHKLLLHRGAYVLRFWCDQWHEPSPSGSNRNCETKRRQPWIKWAPDENNSLIRSRFAVHVHITVEFFLPPPWVRSLRYWPALCFLRTECV